MVQLSNSERSIVWYIMNLVSGFEDGRVFPAGVGPGSPLRDAANWRSSRFSRSVETRRRYGWLRIVLPGARLFRSPIWCSSRGGGAREAGNTILESLVARYRVSTHQIRRLDRRRARGVLNPCARESKPQSGRYLREKLMSDHYFFLPTAANKKRPTGKIPGAFSWMHKALDGWMLVRAPASPAQSLHHHGPRFFNFFYFGMMSGR